MELDKDKPAYSGLDDPPGWIKPEAGCFTEIVKRAYLRPCRGLPGTLIEILSAKDHLPPVAAIPSMKVRWARKKMTMTGRATKVDAAMR